MAGLVFISVGVGTGEDGGGQEREIRGGKEKIYGWKKGHRRPREKGGSRDSAYFLTILFFLENATVGKMS